MSNYLCDLTDLKIQDGCLEIDKVLSPSYGMLYTRFEVPKPDSFGIDIGKLLMDAQTH